MSCCLNLFSCCGRQENHANSPTGNLYQDEPCISKSTIYDIGMGAIGTGVIVGGVLSPPPFNAILITGGATLLAGNTTRAVMACCSEDQGLRNQLDRIPELMEAVEKRTIEIKNVVESNQQSANKFETIAAAFKKITNSIVQRETEADKKALEEFKKNFEEAKRLHTRMAEIMSVTCGALDKMQDAVEKRAQSATAAASSSDTLLQTAGKLEEFSDDQEQNLQRMQESVARYQQVSERLPAFLKEFDKTLGAIQQVNAEIQDLTEALGAQVQALEKAKIAADKQAGEANARADEARAAALKLTAQIEELKQTQEAEIMRLTSKVEGLERIITIVKEKVGEETLRSWIT